VGSALHVKNGKEFSDLKANAGENSDIDFRSIPNHVFAHPFVFYAMEGQGKMTSMKAGTLILKRMEELLIKADESNAAYIGAFVQSMHQTIAFLWASSKGLTPPVDLGNPPNSDAMELNCESVLQQIQGSFGTPTPEPETPPVRTQETPKARKGLRKQPKQGIQRNHQVTMTAPNHPHQETRHNTRAHSSGDPNLDQGLGHDQEDLGPGLGPGPDLDLKIQVQSTADPTGQVPALTGQGLGPAQSQGLGTGRDRSRGADPTTPQEMA
jgi:hypothetical protein